jgi:hypothetical protein
MRIAVHGTSDAAAMLRSNLRQAGYVVGTDDAGLTIHVEPTTTPFIIVDIPDSQFGRLVTHRVAELAPDGGVFVQASGGNLDDRVVVIRVSAQQPAAESAVALGVMRAVDQWLTARGVSVQHANQDSLTRLIRDATTTLLTEIAARDAAFHAAYGADLHAHRQLSPWRRLWLRVRRWV